MSASAPIPFAPPGGWGSQKPPAGVPIDPSHPLSLDIGGFWPPVDGAGKQVADVSGRGLHGSLVNMDSPSGCVPTPRGMALRFDGANDYVSIPNPRLPANCMSAACWASITDAGNNKQLMGQYDATLGQRSWIMGLAYTNWGGVTGKEFTVVLNGNGTSTYKVYWVSGSDVCDGAWRHFAFTWNAGVLLLYINGRLQTPTKYQDASITTIYESPNPMALGAKNLGSSPDSFIAAQMDCPIIYRRCLSAAEIRQLYAEPYCMFEAGQTFSGDSAARPLIDGSPVGNTPLMRGAA